MSAGWLSQPERGTAGVIRLLTWITLRLGRPTARLLLYPICWYFMLFAGGPRRASREYLRHILGRRPRWRDVFHHYHAFASTIHDRVYLLAGRHGYFDIRTTGAGALERVLAEKRGCLLLGSHLGSFEVLRAHGLFSHGLPISVVMHEAASSHLNAVLHELCPEIRTRIIPPGTPDTMLTVKERLEVGELVGILGDRVFGTERSLTCNFLGTTRTFPEGPFMLAALLQVPVVLCFGLYRGGRRYDIHFEPFAEAIPVTRATRAEDLRPWIERYVRRLEHYCRSAPYNWFNFYDLSDHVPASRSTL